VCVRECVSVVSVAIASHLCATPRQAWFLINSAYKGARAQAPFVAHLHARALTCCGHTEIWQPPQAEAFLTSVDVDHLLMLDLWAEVKPA
jgi:hypothetical protein